MKKSIITGLILIAVFLIAFCIFTLFKAMKSESKDFNDGGHAGIFDDRYNPPEAQKAYSDVVEATIKAQQN